MGIMLTQQRRPLYHEPYHRVIARVTCQLVKLDFQRNPQRYEDPAEGVLEYAKATRHDAGMEYFYFNLISLYKTMRAGYTARMWRDDMDTGQRDRALHKQKLRPKR